MVVTATGCLEEDLDVDTGGKLYITYCRTLLTNIFSYTIVSDLAGYRYLAENAAAELWPNVCT